MRQFFSDLMIQMRGIWSRLEGPQRLVVGAVLVATVVGLGAIVWFAGQPSYSIVYTARSDDDLKRVKQAFSQGGIEHVMDDTGFGFMVERSSLGQARFAIAQEGLTGDNSSNFNPNTSFIEDTATKQWKLDAASRAQAQSAIKQLDGVVSVTVTASRPRRTVAFRDRLNEQKAQATVVLRLRAGMPFESTARNAASIAASQLMIPLQDIEVVSATGGQHWKYNPDRDSGAGSSEFLAMQRDMSDERTRMAQERLDQLWPGKIAVTVNIDLDPKWEIRSEKVLPDEVLVKKEEFTKDSTATPSGNEDVEGASSKNEKRTREFITEIGERRVGSAMPEIRRMSVAVLYDKSLQEDSDFQEADLVKTVKTIVGWDPSRDTDDAFSTLASTFAAPAEQDIVYGGPGVGEVALQYAPMVGQVLGVIVVVFFLRGLFKRTGRPAVQAEPEPEVPEESLAPEEQQRRMRREIERTIANDPAALAKLLETWLMEQKA